MAQAVALPDSDNRSPLGRALCVGLDAGMDARLFFDLALERGFVEPALLIGEAATCAAVRAALLEMAALSEPGDLFLLTFSGHGGRKRLPSREVGTWQLYDGSLNDEQLTSDLAQFREGVRVLVVSDNCGGGLPGSPQSPGGSEGTQSAQSPRGLENVARHSPPARRLSAPSRPAIEGFLKASVLVLAACQQNKYADGAGLPGHFASAMNRVLKSSGFNGAYAAFHQALCNEMPSYQRPDCYRLGKPNAAFEAQHPFAI